MAVDVEYLYCSKAAIDAAPAANSAVSSAVSLALSFVSAGPSAAVCAFVNSSCNQQKTVSKACTASCWPVQDVLLMYGNLPQNSLIRGWHCMPVVANPPCKCHMSLL